MATNAEIKEELAGLKEDIRLEHEQANAKLDALGIKIAELERNLADGGTTEERDQILADIKTLRVEAKAIIADEATPEEPPVV